MTMTDPAKSALVLCDLQNDFIHPDGAYSRGGAGSALLAAVPARVAPVAAAMRRAGGWIVSTHFTLVPGKGGAPLMSAHMKKLRPFLRAGDFAPGSWGHALVDALAPADLAVEKVAFSAFYMSRLEWVLRRAGIETLIFTGIITNGGVASTMRDAQVRDFPMVLLSDGCATFSEAVHEATIASLATLAKVTTCAEMTRLISTGPS